MLFACFTSQTPPGSGGLLLYKCTQNSWSEVAGWRCDRRPAHYTQPRRFCNFSRFRLLLCYCDCDVNSCDSYIKLQFHTRLKLSRFLVNYVNEKIWRKLILKELFRIGGESRHFHGCLGCCTGCAAVSHLATWDQSSHLSLQKWHPRSPQIQWDWSFQSVQEWRYGDGQGGPETGGASSEECARWSLKFMHCSEVVKLKRSNKVWSKP